MGKRINNPEIGTIVRHTGWGFENNKNYPCEILITNGAFLRNGNISNSWDWQRVLSDGSLAEKESGYGSFEETNKNYTIETKVKLN